ncbi:MAG: hypothetical protein Q3962_00215 [Corynebacterium sp.]|nr:hypothetical protein [Corynebacterium sp.]
MRKKALPEPVDARAGEIALALVWICIGALVSVLLEVVYLGARIDLQDRHIPIPYMIIIAYLFNGVLTRTVMLWTRNILLISLPLIVWVLGYLGLTFGPAASGAILVGSSIWSILLILAGMAGGYMPLIRALHQRLSQMSSTSPSDSASSSKNN